MGIADVLAWIAGLPLLAAGIATYLLGELMEYLRGEGYKRLISGMYGNWEASIGLHKKLGFRIHRRLSQCRILNILPTPPTEDTGRGRIEDPA